MESIPDVVLGRPALHASYGLVTPHFIESVRRAMGEAKVLSDPADLITYAYDGTFLEKRPDLVVLPTTTAQISHLMTLCSEHCIPVVTRGAGSGLAGGSVPLAGGIVLSTVRMNRLLEVDEKNMCVRVQPGIITGDLQKTVAARGLLYPPDPASYRQSTIGGNIAMCAGGPKGLKYGVTKEYVLGLECVLADGRVMRTGGKMIKNVTGYNVGALLVGSEGTLGIITEATLRLIPRPAATRTVLATFPHIEDAAEIITLLLSAGVTPATIELMDQHCIRAVDGLRLFGIPEETEAVLLIDVDGDLSAVKENVLQVGALCDENGASKVRVAADEEESLSLWDARRAVSPSLNRLRPTKLGEDISVPRSAIPAMVQAIREIGTRNGIQIPVFGHISDGNLHPNLLFDRHNPEDVRRVNRAASEIFETALRLGGTLTGEHGIGSLKQEYVARALDPVAFQIMTSIKGLFDPDCLLNPGKALPETVAAAQAQEDTFAR